MSGAVLFGGRGAGLFGAGLLVRGAVVARGAVVGGGAADVGVALVALGAVVTGAVVTGVNDDISADGGDCDGCGLSESLLPRMKNITATTAKPITSATRKPTINQRLFLGGCGSAGASGADPPGGGSAAAPG